MGAVPLSTNSLNQITNNAIRNIHQKANNLVQKLSMAEKLKQPREVKSTNV